MLRPTLPLWLLYAATMLAASVVELLRGASWLPINLEPLSNNIAAAATAVVCILISVCTAIAFHHWCSGTSKGE